MSVAVALVPKLRLGTQRRKLRFPSKASGTLIRGKVRF